MPTIQEIHDILQAIHGDALRMTPEPQESLQAAEARLGIALPAVLLDYYQLTAHSDHWNQVHNRLLRPDRLEMRDGAFVFYVENQGVTVWGVLEEHLDSPDPPVHAAFQEDELEWEADDESLSRFLIKMAYWQTVNGGLPNIGLGTASEGTYQLVEARWPQLFRDEGYRLSFFGGDGVVVCLFDQEDGSGEIQVATRTPEQLRDLEHTLGVEWDLLETV
ncbi:hypothetical protein LOC68_21310 [Blastopirellula sp. JC732]|uniref:SMI1/KNR4 family protein n=1 Tax=Blastopirellula sediminis TaxID=2894196 RepID=A0A9X1MRY0_9BACT|nr:hypothetical protein [Blastopirellula sediminis]MCC9605763.1 hypothetical protein [Blastopirellula sediminis]MCC9630937.1 hypothetical protein [Blastopirellula sediminis]